MITEALFINELFMKNFINNYIIMNRINEKDHLYIIAKDDDHIDYDCSILNFQYKHHLYKTSFYKNGPDILNEISSIIRKNELKIRNISTHNEKLIGQLIQIQPDIQQTGIESLRVIGQKKWDEKFQIINHIEKENSNLRHFINENKKELENEKVKYKLKSVENANLLKEILIDLANEKMPKEMTDKSRVFIQNLNMKKKKDRKSKK